MHSLTRMPADYLFVLRRYNNMYIYATDALTAHYPRLTDDGVNSYARTHLEMLL